MQKVFLSSVMIRIMCGLLSFYSLITMNIAQAGIIEGNPRGNITLVEFYDYTCPYCRAMNSVLDTLIKENPDLRVVYRPMPIFGSQSWLASSSAVASQQQNDFLMFHHALFNAHVPLTEQNILSIAGNIGMNTQRLLNDMQDPYIARDLQSNMSIANELGVQQLPTIIIGATHAKTASIVFYGVTPVTQLQNTISQTESTIHTHSKRDA